MISDGEPQTVSAADAASVEVDFRLVPLAVTAWAAAFVVPLVPARLVWVAIAVVVASAAVLTWLALRGVSRRGAAPGNAASVADACPSDSGPRDVERVHGWTRRRGWALAVVVALLGGVASATVTSLHVASARTGPVPELAAEAETISAELVVSTDPRRRKSSTPGRPGYVMFDGRIESVTEDETTYRARSSVLVLADDGWANLRPGQRISARGRLSATEPTDRAVAVFSARSSPTSVAEPGVVQRAASALRTGLAEASVGGPGDSGALLPGLVVGDVSAMPPALTEDFTTTGLTHLTAVSGANLTILLVFMLGIARWARIRSWGLTVVGLVCVVGFVVVARPDPSVLRAAAMGLVALAGSTIGQRRHGVPALAIASAALVLVDPWLSRSYGFVLSVLATAGILLFAPRMTEAMARWMPRWCATALAVPLAAQLACAPVVAMLSDSVSMVAVLANLLAAPAVAPATVLGVIAMLLSPLWAPLASVIAWVGCLPAWWIVEVGRRAARLPGAEVPWSTSVAGLVLLAACCLALIWLAPRLLRHRWVGVLLAVVTLIWLVSPSTIPDPTRLWSDWPPKDWRLAACDVGQGDAVVLRAGADAAVLVDTGPDADLVAACLDQLDVRRLPYVVLTHFHADHVGGLEGALRGREVGEIGVSPLPEPRSQAQEVRRVAAERHIPITVPSMGERRRLGPELSWTVLWPDTSSHPGVDPPAADGWRGEGADDSASGAGDPDETGEGSAANDASIVLRADVGGIRVLLTGDVEPHAQRRILAAHADRPDALAADVLKVPHHGSRFQDRRFLRSVDARVAVVSVGADNDYGHPAPRLVRRLKERRTSVLRTDRDGTVAVTGSASHLQTVRRRRWRGSSDDASPPGGGDRDRRSVRVGGSWHAVRRWQLQVRARSPPGMSSQVAGIRMLWARSRSCTARRSCSPSERSPPRWPVLGPRIPTRT